MKYSIGYRNSVLRKVLPPESRSVASVAREMGINNLTIHHWLKIFCCNQITISFSYQ
jgi:transposase